MNRVSPGDVMNTAGEIEDAVQREGEDDWVLKLIRERQSHGEGNEFVSDTNNESDINTGKVDDDDDDDKKKMEPSALLMAEYFKEAAETELKSQKEPNSDPGRQLEGRCTLKACPVHDEDQASYSNSRDSALALSLPGAHAVAPSLTATPTASQSSVATLSLLQSESGATLQGITAPEQNSSGLVEAIQVDEANQTRVMCRARRVEDTATQGTAQDTRTRSLKVAVLCLVLAVVVITASSLVGILIQTESESMTPPSPAPSQLRLHPKTAAPSVNLQVSDTNSVDSLLRILPEYSIASLQDANSPQSLARNWLAQHQNITIIPLWRQEQLFALATFYYAFDGPRWPLGLDKDWLDDTKSECDWYSGLYGTFVYSAYGQKHTGRNACNEKGEFENLVLTRGNALGFSIMSPVMPKEISLLTALKWLELGKNGARNFSMDDMWPMEAFQSLSNLERLRINSENFSPATIPTEIGLLTKLTDLGIWMAQLTGAIPTEVGVLTKLSLVGP